MSPELAAASRSSRADRRDAARRLGGRGRTRRKARTPARETPPHPPSPPRACGRRRLPPAGRGRDGGSSTSGRLCTAKQPAPSVVALDDAGRLRTDLALPCWRRIAARSSRPPPLAPDGRHLALVTGSTEQLEPVRGRAPCHRPRDRSRSPHPGGLRAPGGAGIRAGSLATSRASRDALSSAAPNHTSWRGHRTGPGSRTCAPDTSTPSVPTAPGDASCTTGTVTRVLADVVTERKTDRVLDQVGAGSLHDLRRRPRRLAPKARDARRGSAGLVAGRHDDRVLGLRLHRLAQPGRANAAGDPERARRDAACGTRAVRRDRTDATRIPPGRRTVPGSRSRAGTASTSWTRTAAT